MKKKLIIIILNIIGFLILIIGVPLLINILFKYDFKISIIQAEWNASDALSFYGIIVGGIVTIYGAYLTIKKTIIDKSMPHICVDFLHKKNTPKNMLEFIFQGINTLQEKSANENNNDDSPERNYYESLKNEIIIVIDGKNITYMDGFTDKQKELIKNNGMYLEKVEDGKSIVLRETEDENPVTDKQSVELKNKDLISFPLQIRNIGNSCAVLLKIGLNRNNDDNCVFPLNLDVKEKIYIHIFCENANDEVCGKYTLTIKYNDIYSNKYNQEFPITISKTEDGYKITFDFSLKKEGL